MPRSMTAYHQCSISDGLGDWIIEIYSVNRKGLDISITLPKEFSALEIDIRKMLTQSLSRGQVICKAQYQCRAPLALENDYVLSELLHLQQVWSSRAKQLGMDAGKEISLAFLLSQWDEQSAIAKPIPESLKEHLQNAIQQCLAGFIAMREKEGAYLCQEIQGNIGKIKESLPNITKHTATSYEKAKAKLRQKIQEALQGYEALEDRILKECALLADKLDISEEITRISSHIMQFEQLIQNPASQGRTLEFLIQELFREANTIGSKSSDLAISQIVITIKANLEKIREQVQNLE